MAASADIGFEFAPTGLAVTRHRTIESCNARFCETFGYARHELENQSLAKLYPSSEEFRRIGAIGLERMRGTGRYHDERIMKRRNGEHFWCRVRGQSLTPEDPFAHAVWAFADISAVRPMTRLTRREREVAMLLTHGHTSREIGGLLNISPRTVEAHRSRLLAKLEVRNSSELIARLTGLPG
ncbi:PAS and helix-turn-helix domain-containing protein [Frigidibacter sp. ROC022]|uniref:PAS and helix-turn-helix domain-containing protein n=1 Tax=Frigidibacter sp. ROC022 TaxID=2971796 RepID=UPI00215A4AB6|nr:PAS and helix-turn-helix domain-containing protein [Frigidibacter sp. ROC022]MCR8724077.1 PAS and helix-turn-helix domain-containing protein [Frigidibacter sp. ROC022]